MGEGNTPLIVRNWAGIPVHFKLDFISPSGSFKDRGAVVLASALKDMGAIKVIEDSSGNAGAALAQYSAAVGLKCQIYVPSSASKGKTLQIKIAGAELVLVPGIRQAATDAAITAVEKGVNEGIVYGSHNYHPYFLSGVATVAYEIAEKVTPDVVVVPVGNGSIVLGCYLGFASLVKAGVLKKIPRLVAVQTTAVSPIYDAWEPSSSTITHSSSTIAEGIASSSPPRKLAILQALRETGGTVVRVPEDAICAASKELACNHGLFVEPTAAVAPAAIPILISQRVITPTEVVVVILTGSGLKATETYMKLDEKNLV